MIYDVSIFKVLDCFLIKKLRPVMQRHLLFLPFLTIVTMVWSCTVHGQRNDEQEAEIQAQAEKAQQRYQGKINLQQMRIAQQPDQAEHLLAISRLYRTIGQYEQAVDQVQKALEIDPGSGMAYHILGDLYLLQGNYEAAETQLAKARSQTDAPLIASLHLGMTYLETGRKTEAHHLFQELIGSYQQGRTGTAEDVMAVALAAKQLERFHDANNLLSEATQADPSLIDAYVAWGYLFLEKYSRAEAASTFQDALNIDPSYPPALVGMADALSDKQAAQSEASVRTALAINPNLIEGRHFLAGLFLTDETYDKAVEQLQKALNVNPVSPATQALLAACYHAMGNQAEYEATCRQVLKVNPGYGQLYAIIADNLSRRYRFREAIDMGRKAIDLDPTLWSAYASLGINLSRVAEEEEGRHFLDQAFAHDGFNTWTYNTLELFDSFEAYTTHTSAHFILKLHRDEDPVYGQLALELLEEAHQTMSPRYGFEPERPILVEIFPNHDDFAVRISGLPGAGALLGVCFGEVVVADSPKARPAGSFNWGQTLWHEFAHVIHLQQTRNRIPRWLAEGIAVYEARIAKPEWDIDMKAEFAGAVSRDDLLKVSDLNSGFTRPKSAGQVIMSYYQASIVVEYIVGTYGFDAIRRMLRLYNEDRSTDEIIETVFDVSFDEFDEGFVSFAEVRTEKTRQVLRFTPPQKKKLTQADLEAAVDDNPVSFYAHLFLGRILHAQGKNDEAIELLTKAKALFPQYVQPENPYQLLAEIYLKQKNDEAAIQELEALTAIAEDDIESCKKLAQLYERHQRSDGLIRVLTRAVMINPFDSKVRNMRGMAYEWQSRYEEAILEYQAALAIETTDLALAHYNLARVYLAANRQAEAKQAALKALEIAPNYEAAQEILLKSLE
jgi:tetratricopeptide (TPR) repeat protein